MNEMKLFNNNELKLDIRVIKNDDGSISVNLEDAAKGLGFTQIKNQKEYIKWERVSSYLKEFGISPEVGKNRYIPESVFYLLAMKATNKKAKDFQIWVATKVLPEIRKSNQLSNDPMDILELIFKAQKNTNKKVDNHEKRITDLEENKFLSPGQYNYVGKAVSKKVKQIIDELDLCLTKKQRSKVYQIINRDLNAYIRIRTRNQLRIKDFDKALEFIQNWELSYTDLKIIEQIRED